MRDGTTYNTGPGIIAGFGIRWESRGDGYRSGTDALTDQVRVRKMLPVECFNVQCTPYKASLRYFDMTMGDKALVSHTSCYIVCSHMYWFVQTNDTIDWMCIPLRTHTQTASSVRSTQIYSDILRKFFHVVYILRTLAYFCVWCVCVCKLSRSRHFYFLHHHLRI